MTKVELDKYFTDNYLKLVSKHGADTVNDMYIHFERIIRNPDMSQPNSLAACISNEGFYRKIAKKNKREILLNEKQWKKIEPSTELNIYIIDYDQIVKAFNYLSKPEWKYLKLYIYGDMKLVEIAKETKTNYDTVKTHYRNAISKLRDVLNVGL